MLIGLDLAPASHPYRHVHSVPRTPRAPSGNQDFRCIERGARNADREPLHPAPCFISRVPGWTGQGDRGPTGAVGVITRVRKVASKDSEPRPAGYLPRLSGVEEPTREQATREGPYSSSDGLKDTRRGAKLLDPVRSLPGECGPIETEMSVTRGFEVDRATEVEIVD